MTTARMESPNPRDAGTSHLSKFIARIVDVFVLSLVGRLLGLETLASIPSPHPPHRRGPRVDHGTPQAGLRNRINSFFAYSSFGAYFRLYGSYTDNPREGAKFLNEMNCGITTWLALCYIIAVNATIMTDSGGTCPCDETDRLTCDKNLDYKLCLEDLRQEFSIATAAICAIATFSMGLLANVPIAVGPGMGLNAYFTYTVVGKYGSGLLEYRVALLAVFAEGLVFFALSAFGLRTWLARSIPRCVKQGSGVGIGLYLALIGFTYTAGIGAITPGTNTPIELAGCMPNLMVDGHCPSDVKMTSPRMWLGILCGGFLTLLLYSHRWKAAFIPGIILVSITSWPRDTPFTFFPHDVVGDKAFDFFKQVVAFRPLEHILGANAWYPPPGIRGQFFLVLVSMLYVDILDCTGTLYSMVAHARMIDNTGDFEGSAAAYTVDSLSITVGSLFGLSPVTAYIESGAGISMGAKTGIASMTTGLCFFISMFLAPIFASIPPWATGCTLMIVGGMMASGARHINWYYFGNSFPAFMTLATIPFTYSIAYGLIVGLVLFAFINTSSWLIEKVSRGRIVVPNRDQREDWDFAWPRVPELIKDLWSTFWQWLRTRFLRMDPPFQTLATHRPGPQSLLLRPGQAAAEAEAEAAYQEVFETRMAENAARAAADAAAAINQLAPVAQGVRHNASRVSGHIEPADDQEDIEMVELEPTRPVSISSTVLHAGTSSQIELGRMTGWPPAVFKSTNGRVVHGSEIDEDARSGTVERHD